MPAAARPASVPATTEAAPFLSVPLPSDRWAVLLQAAGRGDESSFETLVLEVRDPLRRRAVHIVNNGHDAEEVVQEALLEAWRHADRYDPLRGRPIAWLHQIVRHRAIDHVRGSVARRGRETRADLHHRSVDFDHTVDSMMVVVDQESVRAAMAVLTPLQREAVQLVYFEDLTSSQAAARIGIPVPTLKTRLRDGIGRLRSVISTAS